MVAPEGNSIFRHQGHWESEIHKEMIQKVPRMRLIAILGAVAGAFIIGSLGSEYAPAFIMWSLGAGVGLVAAVVIMEMYDRREAMEQLGLL